MFLVYNLCLQIVPSVIAGCDEHEHIVSDTEFHQCCPGSRLHKVQNEYPMTHLKVQFHEPRDSRASPNKEILNTSQC